MFISLATQSNINLLITPPKHEPVFVKETTNFYSYTIIIKTGFFIIIILIQIHGLKLYWVYNLQIAIYAHSRG